MHWLWMCLITVVILQMSVLFTTIYLHRTLAHKGLELNRVVASLMHLHLTLFTGIVPRQWVAVHRKHHHYSDKEGDPHSPYLLGLWKVLFGNYFYYRNEARNPQTVLKYTQDYKRTLIDYIPGRILEWGAFGGLAVFMLMFGWMWGAVAWVSHVVLYIFLNSSINSICHMIGYRNFNNLATNVQWIALLTGGEGLHNNHHQYPASARLAMRGHEFDPAWPFIKLLEVLGLARVKPLPSQMAEAA